MYRNTERVAVCDILAPVTHAPSCTLASQLLESNCALGGQDGEGSTLCYQAVSIAARRRVRWKVALIRQKQSAFHASRRSAAMPRKERTALGQEWAYTSYSDQRHEDPNKLGLISPWRRGSQACLFLFQVSAKEQRTKRGTLVAIRFLLPLGQQRPHRTTPP